MSKHWEPGELKAGTRIECDMAFSLAQLDDNVEPGFIKGTASTPSTDLMGHKVLAHAFDKSIRRNGLNGPRGIKLLAQHRSDKPAGVIKRLETVGDDLKIEAQLNLKVSYVNDLYEVSKQIGGLNFSVGFELEEFSFVDGDKSKDGEYLIIKQGNLVEVSVVTFPAQPEATMDFIKSYETLSEFEKALVAQGLCRSRNDAQRMTKFVNANPHLFPNLSTLAVEKVEHADHPLLDAPQLKACNDLIARARRALG